MLADSFDRIIGILSNIIQKVNEIALKYYQK